MTVGATAAVLGLLVSGCGTGTSELEAAHDECRYRFEDEDLGSVTPDMFTARLLDGGRAVQVDGRGEDDSQSEQTGAMLTAICLLEELDSPDSLIARMETTRALDGIQNATYDGYLYSWSYHPSSGMNLLIELETQ